MYFSIRDLLMIPNSYLTRLWPRFFERGGTPSGSRAPVRLTVTIGAGTLTEGKRLRPEGDHGPGSVGGLGRRRHRRRPGKGPSQKGPRDDSPHDGAHRVVAGDRACRCEAQGRYDQRYVGSRGRNVPGCTGRHRLTIPIPRAGDFNASCYRRGCQEQTSLVRRISLLHIRRPLPVLADGP